jgi:hypothetical protein
MGAVYRARDPRFDREVAIKVLHPQFQRDPGVVERFKSEAVIQAKLNHPHIVSVLDFLADEPYLAMVMEHVEGVTLSRLIEESRGPVPVERAVRLMDQVLSAVAYAHKRGLVHRDIKPSNILVQRLEGEEYAKVTDFGIAKILGSEKLRTATGAKMGTLAYMSPEHVRSPKHVDVRSDVYSLGVVLYELLTGRLPYDADSEYDLMQRIVEQPVEAVLDGRVPARLRPALARAMAKAPGERFGSCGEMAEALRRGSGHAPSAAAPEVHVAAAPAVTSQVRASREPSPGVAPAFLSPGVAWGSVAALVVVGALVLVAQTRQEAKEERVRLKADSQHQMEQERRRAEEERARAIAEEHRRSDAAEQQARAAQQAREAELEDPGGHGDIGGGLPPGGAAHGSIGTSAFRLVNGAQWTTTADGEACVLLDGVDDYVSVEASAQQLALPTSPYRVEADVLLSSAPSSFKFIVDGMAADQSGLRMKPGGYPVFKWVTSAGSFSAESSIPLRPGVRQHVRGEWDGSLGRLYVDGQLVAQAFGGGVGSPWRILKVGDISFGGTGTGQFAGCIGGVTVQRLSWP